MPGSASLRVAVLGLLLLLGACTRGQLQSVRDGEPNFNTALLLPSVAGAPITSRTGGALRPADLAKLPGIDALENDCPDADAAGQTAINTCIYALKRIIDDQYREYSIAVHSLAAGGNAVFDIAGLAFSTAAMASPANAAKTILAALAAGALSLKTALNEDLLYKQAIETVLNQMDSDRDRQFAIMLSRMNAGLQPGGPIYTMGAAKDDLLIYFQAGTFDHGITSLQVAAAATKANCQVQLENAKMATGAPSSGPGCGTAGN